MTYKKGLMIVVVGGIKGGSGKTTISTHLAAIRSKKTRRAGIFIRFISKCFGTLAWRGEKAQVFMVFHIRLW